MCDMKTLQDDEKFLGKNKLSRRQFGKVSAGVGLAAMLPPVANAQAVTESEVMIQTPDGTADCYFVHPSTGRHPAVLMWPDILGLRPVMRMMGRRLAESGYSVLVVNPFYRSQPAPVVPDGASFADQAVRDIVFPLAGSLSAETHFTDARAFIGWLDQQSAVDTSRQIGTAGYCMGGPMIMRTAAAVPERVGAAASFHGGGLATDAENSPHLLIPQMQAELLIAIAINDHEQNPAVRDILENAFAAAGVSAEIEVYNAMHGWCMADFPVYDEAEAERAWARMLALFERAL